MTGKQTYDVFISYAHADNEIPFGSSAELGWVGALAANLNTGAGVLRKNIFIDYQLRPGDAFGSELIEKVSNSQVLVIFLSANYAESEWCGKELKYFIEAQSTDGEKSSDIFVVEMTPYEMLAEHAGLPENIKNIRKHTIHAKFWFTPPLSNVPILSGYPTPGDNPDKARIHYWNSLNTLRTAIDERLAKKAEFSRKTPMLKPENQSGSKTAAVLLADVTEDLDSHRNEVRLALESEKFRVLPEGDYIGLSPEEFDQAIAEDLGQTDLFIQLLSPVAGRKGKFAAPLPQLQLQRARAANKPALQWCEQLPVTGQISDPNHAALFETEFLHATNLNNFKTEVIERLRIITTKKNQISTQPQNAMFANNRKTVFIDDLASTDTVRKQLRDTIKQHQYEIRDIPPKLPLGNDSGVDIKEVLRPCLAGITIYTDPSKYVTAYNRLVYFLNQIAEANLPMLRWGVYLLEGDVASLFGIDSEDVVPVYEQDLSSFLQGLSS